MRVGLFGGTFNPIHRGHLEAVRAVSQGLRLDCCHIIPTSRPPHKHRENLAPAADRLHMIRLTVADLPTVQVATLELERPGFSYTVDTVTAFLEKGLPQQDLFLLLGYDAFLEIETWKDYRRLFENTRVVILFRRQKGGESADEQVQTAGRHLKSVVSKAYTGPDNDRRFHHPEWRTVFFFVFDSPDISSTQVRACVRRGVSPAGLVHPAVAGYIEEKGLYR